MKNNLKKRKILNILKYIFIVFIIPFIFVQFLIVSGGKDESDKQVDYVIILGGRVYGDKPSNSLNGGKGKGEEISEAEAIKKELIKNGIDENRIIKEDKSKNTVENLKFILEKIGEERAVNNKKVKVLIVTNGYHLYRSKKIAELLGYEAYGLPATTPFISIPKSYLREFLSIIKFNFEKNNIN